MIHIKSKDEKILMALLSSGTVKGASELAGVSASTIYAKLKDKEFAKEYQKRKDLAINEATAQLISTLTNAIQTISDILNDSETAPQIKLNASQLILSNTLKYTEQDSIIKRIEALEELANNEH